MIGFLLLSSFSVTPARAEVPVDFADAHLQEAVEAALWISDPTPTDMLGLTVLYAGSQGIRSLAGLGSATNLESLYLDHNQISDLSPLAGLAHLETLALNTNNISDLSPLAGLESLRSLNLHANEISDLAPLAGLRKLETLILRINSINDMSALAGLENLETLAIDDNEISDIAPLGGLRKLQYLRIGYNRISNLSPLARLSSLWYLDAHRNRIRDITPLGALSNLETLILEDNHISDIRPLCALMSLSRLELSNNPLAPRAYDVYLPQIIANNPGLYLRHESPAGWILSVYAGAGGSIIDPGEGKYTYDDNESVRLQAQADTGFAFAGWSGTRATAQNPFFVLMDQNHQIKANFVSGRDVLHVDDDAPADPGPANAQVSDPQENGSPEHPYDRIEEAVEVAAKGASIVVHPGNYRENIDLSGKSVRLLSAAAMNETIIPYPVLEGSWNGPIIRFNHSAGMDCLLMGFVIMRGSDVPAGAILCDGGSPTISNCLIVGNRSTDPNGAVVYCRNSRAVLTNCTIADNYAGEGGAALMLVDSSITMTNSILWGNIPNEILSTGTGNPSIRYCNIAGWWPDYGNLDTDPLFVRRGLWVDPGNPGEILGPKDPRAVWTGGDYRLQSQAGRWDPTALAWVRDAATSPCIDHGDEADPVGNEPLPNGGIINMGAYGGTPEAGKSPLGTVSP